MNMLRSAAFLAILLLFFFFFFELELRKSFKVKMNFISYVHIRGSRWLYTFHANCKMLIESDTFSHGYHCIFDGVEIVCHSLATKAFF